MIETRPLAEKIFELFIVNNTAIAVQDTSGVYRTKYISPFNSSLIDMMLKQKESLGCYQQTAFGKIRWLCLDFDIREKSAYGKTRNLLLNRLYKEVISMIKLYLDEHHISYLTEFSGRRGIHVWIIFSKPISKAQGFFLIQKICRETGIQERLGEVFGLDKFPATYSAKGNKVGKQVKIPLSCHKKGGQSYFFNGNFKLTKDVNLVEQYEILTRYEPNDSDTVFSEITDSSIRSRPYYYKYEVCNGIECNPAEIIDMLSEIPVFKTIFNRFRQGIASTQDFLVMLGVFTPLDNGKDFLKSVLDFLGVLNEDLFEENYRRFHSLYHPATIGYLNDLYSIDDHSFPDDMSGFDYLAQRLELPSERRTRPEVSSTDDRERFNNLIDAEIDYAKFNDEILLPDTIDDLRDIGEFYFQKFMEDITEIKKGCLPTIEPSAFCVQRHELTSEQNKKHRDMFVLNGYNRVITTYLALNIRRKIKQQEQGFSYLINNLSYKRIFYNWYYLWQQYLNRIETELTLPFWQESYVMVTDLRQFYDSVDYLAISRIFQSSLSAEEQNMLAYLIQFNERLMKKYTGQRVGVPQGPAYARILAELYINYILARFKSRFPQYAKISIIRYVDDFFIRSEENNLQCFLDDFEAFLSGFRLKINHEKTRIFGRISDMSEEDIWEATKKNTIKYGFRNDESAISSSLQIQERMDMLLNSFDSNSAQFVFNKKIDKQYALAYFSQNFKTIMRSDIGRGSMFTRFYTYYFTNIDLLGSKCKDATNDIPHDSLNQYCFISSLYSAIRSNLVTRSQYDRYISQSIEQMHEITLKEIRDIISAIREWSK